MNKLYQYLLLSFLSLASLPLISETKIDEKQITKGQSQISETVKVTTPKEITVDEKIKLQRPDPNGAGIMSTGNIDPCLGCEFDKETLPQFIIVTLNK